MSTHMNRRSWLKKSVLLTGGITLGSNWIGAKATPRTINSCTLTDFEIARQAPPELKARLFANENPFGPSDKAKKAIHDCLGTCYQYPMQSGEQLGKLLETKEGVPMDMIMPGGGSSPLLHAVALYAAKEGGNVISADPSYEDIPYYMEQVGAKWKKIPLTHDYHLDLTAMEKAVDNNTRLVYICNPNNPTGTALDTAALKSFCERVSKKTLVFVDEAYIDYLGNVKNVTMLDCVQKGQNVIVARTLSKLYGFAGLRMGYIMARPDLIKKIEPYSTSFFTLSAPAIHAAIAGLNDDAYLKDAFDKTERSKQYLYSKLKEEGYSYIPSKTNFVMFPLQMDGKRFTEEMMKRGVGLRDWKLNGKDWCRISIGRMDEMEAFATAFKELS
jgi:histidinol-phosphate aminotransferase